MNKFLKRTWAEINLDNIIHNINQIKNHSPNSELMGVVKADAYGHGDKIISQTMQQQGIKWFGVSNINEALSLRKVNITQNILIFGFTPIENIILLCKYNIIQTIYNKEYAIMINDFCVKNNIKIKCHIKIDTGMGRLGIVQSENHSCINDIIFIFNLSNLIIEGIFSHFSQSDDLNINCVEYTNSQINYFNNILKELKNNNIKIKYKHLQNSGGVLNYNNLKYDIIRSGLLLYGISPCENKKINLLPAMELKTTISMIKTLPKDSLISYSGTYKSNNKVKVATLPIGYADGYPRRLSNNAKVLINGKLAPVIGNICMDQMMIDVTDIHNTNIGDTVTLFGNDNNNFLSIQQISKWADTIPYEIMCVLGRRVPRIYFKNNKVIKCVDYIIGNNFLEE